ncbi:helix-turn-helix domain-containing protein [Streptomyces rishiriensis]|uniref:AraC-like DNA-binding protein n=1 Tax=Streptomyces rishiriensis TaxID=68264 RepID=A0ABU0NL64_STRRH|nr:helix-turn-helix domain-containing protein [Streptomyces rishiriensis]MDQ0579458.1 AraC-like DNA-binding protein [Streptomyces rishiriensis]
MPTTSTSTCDSARTLDPPAYRTPLGVEITTGEQTPARLPGRTSPHPAHRLLARDGGEYLFVGLRGGARPGSAAPAPAPAADEPIDALGLRLAPGDVCFYDVHRAPALDFREPFRATTFLVPAELLGLADSDVRRIARTPVARASRLGTLLSPLLSDLARATAEARPPVGEMLAWNAVNLLATLAAEQLATATPGTPGTPGTRGAPGTPGTHPPVLGRVLEYVEIHLTDPDLSPEVIARAHHISVRYLHKLFKDEGTTVGRWILRRRLEECRRDLMRYGRGGRTIAAVAARWGFPSATHFSRVFRSAYGMSPREWRDTAGRGTRGDVAGAAVARHR